MDMTHLSHDDKEAILSNIYFICKRYRPANHNTTKPQGAKESKTGALMLTEPEVLETSNNPV